MDAIRDEGLPDAFSPATITRDKHQAAFRTTSFGPLVQELQVPIAGQKRQPLWVQNPFAFLEVAAAESHAFSEFLRG
eukprot:7611942-Pyramimonas_sp.AAC.1